MLESKLERQISAYALGVGCLTFKLAGSTKRGKPDRIFLIDGQAGFVEFKSPGKKPSPLQDHWLTKLRDAGFPSVFIDDRQVGQRFIDSLIPRVSK